jgi:hypothetical protein
VIAGFSHSLRCVDMMLSQISDDSGSIRWHHLTVRVVTRPTHESLHFNSSLHLLVPVQTVASSTELPGELGIESCLFVSRNRADQCLLVGYYRPIRQSLPSGCLCTKALRGNLSTLLREIEKIPAILVLLYLKYRLHTSEAAAGPA